MIEATYPGAASRYLDMSVFLDDAALRPALPEIAEINRRYKALYGEAYDILAAGAALLPKNHPGLWGDAERAKLDKKLSGLAGRELRRLDKAPRTKHRFLSAVSCRGRMAFTDTLTALCGRVCVLDNVLGLGHYYLERLAALARERGYDAVLCHDPLEPEKLEAVLLPEADLAFLAAGRPADAAVADDALWRHLRLDALADKTALADARPLLRRRRRESALLLEEAVDTLAQAKTLHDALEAAYRPHVDFAGADALAEEHIRRLLG